MSTVSRVLAATLSQAIGSYYFSVSSLTVNSPAKNPIEALPAQTSIGSLFSPTVLMYAPLLLFLLLFIAAYGLQALHKIKNYRNVTLAVLLSLSAAAIPSITNKIQHGIQFYPRAEITYVPHAFEIKQISDNELLIEWVTDAVSVGAIRYWNARESMHAPTVVIANSGKAVRDHSVIIHTLHKNVTYHAYILSDGNWYDNKGLPLELLVK